MNKILIFKEFEDFFSSLRPQFNPFMILDVIPRLMNHMVVSLMNTHGSSVHCIFLPITYQIKGYSPITCL